MAVFKSFKDLERSLNKRLIGFAREASEDLAQRVFDDTPRKTNQLVSNWNTSVGAPDVRFTEGKVDLSSYGDMKVTINGWEVDQDLFVANYTHYGALIEYGGWSNKAPNGMVRINTNNWQNIASQVFDKYFG